MLFRSKFNFTTGQIYQNVIEERDKDFSIYEVPLSLVEHVLDNWPDLLHRLRNPETEISIAVVGKYVEHKDAYKSIYEAIDHAGIEHHAQIRIGRIQSETVERERPTDRNLLFSTRPSAYQGRMAH